MKKTFGTIFSGARGADLGIAANGYESEWAIEYDSDIAELASIQPWFMHEERSALANLLDVYPQQYPSVSHIHISPPCVNFSGMKVGATELPIDLDLACKCVSFIRFHEPETITIENVSGYLNSRSYQYLMGAIRRLEYICDCTVVNLARFGVPQDRTRLIVRASKYGLSPLDGYFTHGIDNKYPTVSWHQAIWDILPNMPINDDGLTKDQKAAIARYDISIGKYPLMVQRTGGSKNKRAVRDCRRSSWTIKASSGGDNKKINGKEGNRTKVIDIVEPDGTVRSLSMRGVARLMSFPDSYKLPNHIPWAKQWRALGNAVPPLAMKNIMRSLI